MGKELSKKVLAIEYLKVSSSHKDNRCDRCGRRLKLHPGGLILWAPRYTTCRSCGYENPSMSEKVAESLTAAGYQLPSEGGVSELPACLTCGVELQVSRDYTKVFCRSCGREWSVPEFEDILEGPINVNLAGKLPMQPDESKLAKELLALLEQQNIDCSTPYFVAPLVIKDTREAAANSKTKSSSFLKEFRDGFKEGLSDSKSEEGINKLQKNSAYLVVFEEYLAKYAFKDGLLQIQEAQYAEFLKRDQDSIDPGFEITFSSKRTQSEYSTLVNEFRTIFLANQSPYQEVLFGKAKVAAEKTQNPSEGESVAEQIQKLAELKNQGLLTEEEFISAKAKILRV